MKLIILFAVCLSLCACDNDKDAIKKADLAQYYQSFRSGNSFTPMHGAALVESSPDFDKWMIRNDSTQGENAYIYVYFVTVVNGKITAVYSKTKYN